MHWMLVELIPTIKVATVIISYSQVQWLHKKRHPIIVTDNCLSSVACSWTDAESQIIQVHYVVHFILITKRFTNDFVSKCQMQNIGHLRGQYFLNEHLIHLVNPLTVVVAKPKFSISATVNMQFYCNTNNISIFCGCNHFIICISNVLLLLNNMIRNWVIPFAHGLFIRYFGETLLTKILLANATFDIIHR